MRLFLFLLSALGCSVTVAAKTAIPYGFIENKGQVIDAQRIPNPQVKYLLNTPGLNVQLQQNSFSYDTYINEQPNNTTIHQSSGSTLLKTPEDYSSTYRYHRVDITFPGANTTPEIIAEDISPDVLNYYNELGHFENIRHYRKITYKNLYPGIDLEFVTGIKNKAVEYNFIVHPGADASRIQLHYSGASAVSMENGKIINSLALGKLEENIPASFIQETKAALTVVYRQTAPNTFGYYIPAYDKSKTLVIDPTPDLAWGTYYGGSADDRGYDITIEGSDVYTAGTSQSSTNIATSGAYQTSLAGTGDAFIAKFDRTGVRQWATYYGGSGTDIALGASAISGTVCIVGQTNSASGIATTSSYQSSFGGSYDGFLAKFTSSGIIQFATYIGGNNIEYGSSVAISTAGPVATIYVTGATASSTNIPVTNAHQNSMAGVADAFLIKYSFTGFPIWGTYAGSTNLDEGYAVATDASGNVFMAGLTYQPTNNNLITASSHQPAYGGDTTDYFLQKYNSNGQLLWGTYYGGSKGEERIDGEKLAIDASGNVYMAGSTFSANGIATTSSHQPALGGGLGDEDGFLAKFSNAGVLQWATYYGGSDGDLISAITTDNNGNVYTTGYTFSTTGIATNGAHQTNLNGTNLDAFIVKFNSTGGRLWASYYGGTDLEVAEAIAIDGQENAYLTGFTRSASGIATTGAHQPAPGSTTDAFISRFRACNIFSFSATATAKDVSCYGKADGIITVSATGGTQPYLYKFGSVGGFQATDTFKNLGPGTYPIMAMDDNGCMASVNAIVNQPVLIYTPTVIGPATIHQKDTATYTTPVQAGALYQWNVTGGNIESGQGTAQVLVKWIQAGPGEVKVKLSGSATSACPDSAVQSVFVSFPDLVNEVLHSTLSVYPNPANDRISVTSNSVNHGDVLRLFDLHGKLILSQPLKKYQVIDITDLPRSIYLITAGSDHIKFTKL